MRRKKGKLVIISGFSGVGKGTVVKELLDKHQDEYVLSVSMTTRAPREGEQEGVNYYYVSDEQFEDMIENDGFLEHAGYVGHYYGTPKKLVTDSLNKGKNVVLEIEVQGALQVKEKYPESIMIFIIPPSARELKNRLVGRGSETPEQIEGRLKRAGQEAGQMEHYDYLVVNDIVEDCAERIHEITQTKPDLADDRKEVIRLMQEDVNNFLLED